MAEIRHEAPSRRRYYRITVPINVTVRGEQNRAMDWSLGGFKVGGVSARFTPGEEFTAGIELMFQGYRIGFDQKARVVRFDEANKKLAAEFIEMDDRNRAVLEFFS